MLTSKILVVDDDNDYLESISSILKANGYEVLTADNGEDGFKKAVAENPQLIIIDLLMNTVNEGYDFCLKAGYDKRVGEIPLLMISSAHNNKAFKDGDFTPDRFLFPIDAFLDKPVDKEDLLRQVSSLLSYRENPNRK